MMRVWMHVDRVYRMPSGRRMRLICVEVLLGR